MSRLCRRDRRTPIFASDDSLLGVNWRFLCLSRRYCSSGGTEIEKFLSQKYGGWSVDSRGICANADREFWMISKSRAAHHHANRGVA